jgi:chaperonin GroEL (HSP60 family)
MENNGVRDDRAYLTRVRERRTFRPSGRARTGWAGKSVIDKSTSNYDREKVQERLVKLAGGVALLRAQQALKGLTLDDSEEQIGVRIIERALEEPIRQISINAGVEGSIVVQKVCESNDKTYGYNARTDEVGGLGWPASSTTKVTRTVLQNASSIAGLLLTTPRRWSRRSLSPKATPLPCRAAAAWETCTEPDRPQG